MCANFAKYKSSCQGMTLVELVIVMAILSVVMMAVMSLYVPAHQSTVAQTQVSDVNANLRLALKTMTRDLMIAGFLVPINPVVFEASSTPTTAENPDPKDFTIRTRIIGSHFARVIADTTNLASVKVSKASMADNFPSNSLVRMYEPISTNEINVDSVTNNADRVYVVSNTTKDTGSDTATLNISDPNLVLAAGDVITETVIVRVPDSTDPPLQTIRYKLDNDSLERYVNGSLQVLARNIDTTSSRFDYRKTGNGEVNWVEINLIGKTKALKDDVISGEKTREISTSVKLRNIN